MNRNRAYIRHCKKRARNHVKHIVEEVWGMSRKDFKSDEGYQHWLNIMVTTHAKPCSCSMCGNPRRYFNDKTIQEKKFEIEVKEQLEEVENESE